MKLGKGATMANYVFEWAEITAPVELLVKMVRCEFGHESELLEAVYYGISREDMKDLEWHLNRISPASDKEAVETAELFLWGNYYIQEV